MKRILFVASECVPFVKTGGLADVIGALPGQFDKSKYEVRVFLPYYLCMSDRQREDIVDITNFYMDFSGRKEYVGIKYIKYNGIEYYFLDNEYYFSGITPYNNIYDDVWKFGFFCKGIVKSLEVLDYKPDVIHCHDWQASLLPALFKYDVGQNSFYSNIKTIMTIHNLEFKGRCRMDVLKTITGYSDNILYNGNFDINGEASLLKSGIALADYITTVSKTYSEEICTHYYGEGLEDVLNSKKDCLYGIVNGVDYNIFDPENDPYTVENYSIIDYKTKKTINKLALQKKLGLSQNHKNFVIGFISRLTEQKGIDLICQVMHEMCTDDVQFLMLGTGERRYEDKFRYFQQQYPDRVVANICYSDELAHMMYAGCDALLMPSRFEPCGLCQLMSFRYGTVPIVRETGGLKDTVCDYGKNKKNGNGFVFSKYNAYDMLYAIRHAKKIFSSYNDSWQEIMERGMKADFSWKSSAKEYEKIYNLLIG